LGITRGGLKSNGAKWQNDGIALTNQQENNVDNLSNAGYSVIGYLPIVILAIVFVLIGVIVFKIIKQTKLDNNLKF
jgi:large-conductance mechanosensitive channel